MGLLTRDQIQNGANRLPHIDVECPELGGAVRIRTMRAKDKEALSLAMSKDGNDGPGFMSLVVHRCAVDESGALLFPSPDAAGEVNGVAMERLFREALKLNRMGRFEEEAIKNSEPAPNDGSSSDSP